MVFHGAELAVIEIACSSCGRKNEFQQPYPFHAGFGDQGFLYNDAGNLTLVWSAFDPAYEAIVGRANPWVLNVEQQVLFENELQDAPSGGRWRFANPARCSACASSISGPMKETIYYLRFPNSLDVDTGRRLRNCLRQKN